jgi:hypothetical protein
MSANGNGNGRTHYPKTDVEDPARPFHLWDAVAQEQLRWRCYSDKRRAAMSAMIEARYAKVGTTIEVIDVRTARMLGQYTRRIDTITFRGA